MIQIVYMNEFNGYSKIKPSLQKCNILGLLGDV
jgi:hypothetical protein